MSSVAKSVELIGENLRPGQSMKNAITVQRMNAIMDTVRGLARGDNIRTGRGVRKIAAADGVVLSPYRTYPASRGYPFDMAVSGTKVTFTVGTINGLIPTNLGTGVTITGVGTEYMVLNIAANNGQITTATVVNESSQPGAIQPNRGTPPTGFQLLLGLTVNGVPFKIWGNGNIKAFPRESFRLPKIVLGAGQLPYDIFYDWEFSVV